MIWWNKPHFSVPTRQPLVKASPKISTESRGWTQGSTTFPLPPFGRQVMSETPILVMHVCTGRYQNNWWPTSQWLEPVTACSLVVDFVPCSSCWNHHHPFLKLWLATTKQTRRCHQECKRCQTSNSKPTVMLSNTLLQHLWHISTSVQGASFALDSWFLMLILLRASHHT